MYTEIIIVNLLLDNFSKLKLTFSQEKNELSIKKIKLCEIFIIYIDTLTVKNFSPKIVSWVLTINFHVDWMENFELFFIYFKLKSVSNLSIFLCFQFLYFL